MSIIHEYETTFIFRPEVNDEELNRLRARFEAIITDRDGQLMVFEDWGRRKMAYTISRHDHGRYIYLNYLATSAAPAEIERIVGIEDNVIRFLTVRLAENADFDTSMAAALERQKKRVNRGNRSDDDGRDNRRRRASAHVAIKSPSPVRYENADGSSLEPAEPEQEEAAPEAVESEAPEHDES